MRIVQGDQIEWKRGLQHRGGTFHYRHLLDGTPGTSGNFQFNIGQLDGDFLSPRHRHNFDQFRFQLEGTMDFSRTGKMTAGMFGYFPEGAYYGPQSSEGRSLTAVLQFGGASGSGYLSRREVQAGTEELKKFGEFKDGVFHRRDDVPGPRNRDAYEAIWEHVYGQEMTYPKPRYSNPILLDPANYDWVAIGDMPGAAHKPLGTFTERQCAASLLKLDAGARYRADGPSIYFVISGLGRIDAKSPSHEEPYRAFTTLHLDDGDVAVLSASDETRILRLMLPDLTGMEHRRQPETHMQAAE